jgi:hypothetical protein
MLPPRIASEEPRRVFLGVAPRTPLAWPSGDRTGSGSGLLPRPHAPARGLRRRHGSLRLSTGHLARWPRLDAARPRWDHAARGGPPMERRSSRLRRPQFIFSPGSRVLGCRWEVGGCRGSQRLPRSGEPDAPISRDVRPAMAQRALEPGMGPARVQDLDAGQLTGAADGKCTHHRWRPGDAFRAAGSNGARARKPLGWPIMAQPRGSG